MSTSPVFFEILGKTYEVACAPEQRDSLDQAAELLRQHAKRVQDSDPRASNENIVAITALNICHEYLNTKNSCPHQLDTRLKQMTQRISDALEQGKNTGFA